ncbi:G-protein coupled receptor GRL101-like [Pocillopora verrucosa]|uniref:G-protein coupled receptor GRL101-like n=1 Tax=Pocillopora verrucosa TaxID=203993 RepID=UPI00333ECC52
MAELPKGFFKHLTHIIRVTLDTNLMCCHLDLFRQDADCEYSFNDNFASCHSMFRHHAPRRTLWIVGLLSLLGSLFVVGWQYFYPDNNVVQSIMLVNLGVSDGIMGIYLIIIGIKDLQWSGEYYLHDYEWRTGWFCHFNGAMSVFSSEVSVMMISLIALDRLKNIVFPYTFAKITPRQTCLMCVVIWLVGGVMAFLPLSGMHYFSEWYYGNNVVCLPLQLSPELQEGWEYSTSIFIVLNFSLFIFITVAYVAILWKSWSSSRRLGAHGTVREIRARAQSAQAKRERALAKRVFFIILTDFLCWMPIIAIGIRSHVEKTFDPPGDLAVWIAVFALPINSAINPLLYTLSTPQVTFLFWLLWNSTYRYVQIWFRVRAGWQLNFLIVTIDIQNKHEKVQPVLKAKLRKLWSNVRSIFNRRQNQEGFQGGEDGTEAENDQQGQIGNGDEHANVEEGEQIEMQLIAQIEIPEVEAPELPAPQPEIEQACEGDANPSSSDYEDDFDIKPASAKTVEGEEGGSKHEPKKTTEEAVESEEQVEIEEISVPSNKEARKADEEEETHEPDMDVVEEVLHRLRKNERVAFLSLFVSRPGEEDVFDTRPL